MRCWKIGLLVLAGVAALGGVVMLLWNWLVPGLFSGGREIDYLQALGLLVLSRILFGGMRGRGHWHGHHRWERMTPEEREKFLSGRHGCCSGRDEPGTGEATEGRE